MKIKKIKKSKIGGYHTLECDICSEMAKRGYYSEAKYWEDFFNNKLKPIKYKLLKV